MWKQTPDGRPGWAYYLINQGYVVYMVDYPARGRSPYVPDMDGKLGLRTAPELVADLDRRRRYPAAISRG